MNDALQIFHTESGQLVPGLEPQQLHDCIKKLEKEYGYSTRQIVEVASYSFAMVVRVALGFSAHQARALCLCSDSLAGWITLACARQLQNAGTECELFIQKTSADLSPTARELLQYFRETHSEVNIVENYEFHELDAQRVQSYHLALSGLVNLNSTNDTRYAPLIELCNEYQLPVHSVIAPLGIDLTTGKREGVPLLSSSTLSLGLPLGALNAGSEYAGRHYIADISFPWSWYHETLGIEFPLFSAQPVVQLFVPQIAEESPEE